MANPNIVHINEHDTPVAAAARLEAMMTYQQRQIGHDSAEFVFLNPRIVKSKRTDFQLWSYIRDNDLRADSRQAVAAA
jgi:hypothetical protein